MKGNRSAGKFSETNAGSKPSRRSIRLAGYDYSQPGAYFVTICANDRKCLFGKIAAQEMILNDAGRMVENVWNELPQFYPHVSIDAFQIMPNHIHGIIIIRSAPTTPAGNGVALSLPDIVHRFKTMTTKRYVDGVKQNGWPPFPGKLWQRNYYEHIIRNENELERIREYIANNPAQWSTDRENPMARMNPAPLEHVGINKKWSI